MLYFRFFILISILFLQTSFAQNKKIQGYLLSTPANQDVVLLQVKNQSSKVKELSLGINQEFKINSTLPSLSEKKILIECRQKGNDQEVPPLTLWVDGQRFPFPKISKSDGNHNEENPIIWIDKEFSQSTEYEMLQAVKKIHGTTPLRIDTKEFPTHLSSIGKSPLIITSLSAFLNLSAQQKQNLKSAIYAGSTLLIAVGDGAGDEHSLQGFSGVKLGNINPPEDGYSVKIPSYRELFLDQQSIELVVNKGNTDTASNEDKSKPLLTENQLGLGRVRVLSIRLNHLLSSQLYRVAFSLNSPHEWDRDILSKGENKKEKEKEALLPLPTYQKIPRPGFEQLSHWLDDRFEPLNATEHLFQSQIIYIFLIAFILFQIAKRSVIYLGIAFICLLIIAFTSIPVNEKLQTHKAKLLYLPMEEGALVLGMIDLSFFYQGEQFKEIKTTEQASMVIPQISLLETQTQGLCLIHELELKLDDQQQAQAQDEVDMAITLSDQGLEQTKIEYTEEDELQKVETKDYYHSSWFLKGQLGSRQRIKFIATVNHIPAQQDQSITITSDGPWKGLELKALASPNPHDFLLPALLNKTEAWLVPQSKIQKFKPLELN